MSVAVAMVCLFLVPGAWPLSASGGQQGVAFPLKVSANARYLVDQNDRPFFYLADTAWTMLGYLRVSDAEKLIDLRREQGFTAIQTVLVPWGTGRSGARGEAFENNDLTRPNESYFAGVDQMMKYAESRGMVLYVVPLWMADNGGWGYVDDKHGEPAPSLAAMKSFMSWVGNRYRNQGNLIWVMGGDDETSRNRALKEAGAEALRAADPNHLITYHPRWAEYGFKDERWYDIYAFQKNDTRPPFNYVQIRAALALKPAKPVLDAEPPYEPDTAMQKPGVTSPLVNRRFGWWAALSGTMGVAYGGPRQSWAIGYEDGKSVAPEWDAVNRAPARQTGIICRILSPLPWEKLVPDWKNETVTQGRGTYGSEDYVTAGRASDGSTIVAFTPSSRTLTVDLTKLRGAGRAQWYDPASGEPFGKAQSVGHRGKKRFKTPGRNSVGDTDWVLVIRAE